jgi:Protein of unknown function with HXXEE motif
VRTTRVQPAFAGLILAQTAHSIEEYAGRLWESFPPARFVSGLISSDLERNFLLLNGALIAVGVWCLFWPVRRGWPVAGSLAWIWVMIEVFNSAGHILWSLLRGGYTPGVATAPVLLLAAGYLGCQLKQEQLPA